MHTRAYIGIGSNVGDRQAHHAAAVNGFNAAGTIVVVRVSTAIETAPVGPIDQPPFLNAVVAIDTELSPSDLLEVCQTIERSRGRDRGVEERWGPRTLDLDILVFGDQTIDQPGLTIPHPRLHEREFVLVPLAEIAPELVTPGGRLTVEQSLRALRAEPKPNVGA